MPITTSYFGASKKTKGIKISVARFNAPYIRGGIDEVIASFAPSPKLLMDYRDGRISWPQYRSRYIDEQRAHYKTAAEDFEELLRRSRAEEIVLLCYERFEGPKTKCHRLILYELLKKIAKKENLQVKFIDEKEYKPIQ